MYYSVDPYLAHFGVLGMKWGVRRYQNKDGSLTPEGEAHYGLIRQKAIEASNSNPNKIDKYVEEEKRKLGIKSIDEDTDLIPKGTIFTRITSGDDKLDNDRKYVSLLKDDNQQYESMWESLPLSDYNSVRSVEYTSTGNIKVATYKKVREELKSFIGDKTVNDYVSDVNIMFGKERAKQILKSYGDTKITDLTYDPKTREALLYDPDNAFTNKELNENKWLKDYLTVGNNIVDRVSDKIVMGKNRQSEFYDHMTSLGYDAFVDPYDASGSSFQYPLVLLNPKDHVKQTKDKSLFED